VGGLQFGKLVISLLLRGIYKTYLDLQVLLGFLLALLDFQLDRFDLFGMSVYQHLIYPQDIPILHLNFLLLDSLKSLLVVLGLISKLFLKIGNLRLIVSLNHLRELTFKSSVTLF
jgi:hypothetical protein